VVAGVFQFASLRPTQHNRPLSLRGHGSPPSARGP
jgi:hypothetical protein